MIKLFIHKEGHNSQPDFQQGCSHPGPSVSAAASQPPAAQVGPRQPGQEGAGLPHHRFNLQAQASKSGDRCTYIMSGRVDEAEDEEDTLRSLREAVCVYRRTACPTALSLTPPRPPFPAAASGWLTQDEEEKRARLDTLGPHQLRLLLRRAKRQRMDSEARQAALSQQRGSLESGRRRRPTVGAWRGPVLGQYVQEDAQGYGAPRRVSYPFPQVEAQMWAAGDTSEVRQHC
jgi:hypothetical protein